MVDLAVTHVFVLELLEAMYGLVDGPLLWQLAFMHYLVRDLHFSQLLHDDTLFPDAEFN